MKSGDLISFPVDLRGWTSFPEEYNFHSRKWVEKDLLGLVLESKDNYSRVLVLNHALWFETRKLKSV